jgi:hypothetical protein
MAIVTPTPTLTLADKLVNVIRDAWRPSEPSGVTRAKDPDFTEESVSELTGRRVFVIPLNYNIGPGTRGKSSFLHRINVLTVERYHGPGTPPEDWSDALADFVYARFARGLDFGSGGGQLLFDGRAVRTTTIGDVDICIREYLSGHHLFWSEVPLEFGEDLP